MRRSARPLLLAVVLRAVGPGAVAPSAGLAATPDAEPVAGSTASAPRIVEVYPNPPRADDRGEYVRIRVPAGNWTLSDGESTVSVSVGPGHPVVTGAPDALPNGTEGTVLAAPLSLAGVRERLTLHEGAANGRQVDAIEYGSAPEGERWLRNTDPPWRPVGYHPRDPASVGTANATAFVLPDAPGPPAATLREAERRLLLAGYTFESERTTEGLLAAERRGVRVRVLVDDAPVGGITDRQARLLDRLVAAGVEVRALGGPVARFRYHHAKYAVVDDSALVLTENWKPAGTGGADSRGWGVRLHSPAAADELASVFEHDAGWRDARPWDEYRTGRSFTAADPATDTYPRQFDPVNVRIRNATVLTAPGNAETGVVRVVDAATERVDVVQPTVEDGPMLAATRRAAERGV